MTLCLVLVLAAVGVLSTPQGLDSGLAVGAEAPAFDPRHVAGPDKGSHACPMCKYGRGQGILAWVNTETLDDVAALTARLEKEMRERGEERLRAFVIYMNPDRLPAREVEKRLEEIAARAGVRKVALTWIPSPTDEETAALYKINPDPRVKNTMIVYAKRRIVEKFVNLPIDTASLGKVLAAVEGAADKK